MWHLFRKWKSGGIFQVNAAGAEGKTMTTAERQSPPRYGRTKSLKHTHTARVGAVHTRFRMLLKLFFLVVFLFFLFFFWRVAPAAAAPRFHPEWQSQSLPGSFQYTSAALLGENGSNPNHGRIGWMISRHLNNNVNITRESCCSLSLFFFLHKGNYLWLEMTFFFFATLHSDEYM